MTLIIGCHSAEFREYLSVMLNVVMLYDIMLNVVSLIVVMLNVVMLNVVAPPI